MKIYLDTANIEEIKQAVELGFCDGVTTNPTLIASEGRDLVKTIKEIAGIVKGPVNAEVTTWKTDEMTEEGKRLAGIASNVVVKIPFTREGIKTVRLLAEQKIKVNLTLIFSPSQALLAARAGAHYATAFMGRLDDAGLSGAGLIRETMTVYNNYGFNTELIVASVRSTDHVLAAALAGAPIATVPMKVLKTMIEHPLTEAGIEKFKKDACNDSR